MAATSRIAVLVALCATLAVAQNPATSVSVDVNANHRAISPNICGVSYGDTYDIGTLNAPLNRSSQPFVSTLNSVDGSVVANAAIVPAGRGRGDQHLRHEPDACDPRHQRLFRAVEAAKERSAP